MTAIRWFRLKSFRTAPPCDGGCKTDAKARGIGAYRMEILGHPAGFWCLKCRNQMNRAWVDAAAERFPERVAA